MKTVNFKRFVENTSASLAVINQHGKILASTPFFDQLFHTKPKFFKFLLQNNQKFKILLEELKDTSHKIYTLTVNKETIKWDIRKIDVDYFHAYYLVTVTKDYKSTLYANKVNTLSTNKTATAILNSNPNPVFSIGLDYKVQFYNQSFHAFIQKHKNCLPQIGMNLLDEVFEKEKKFWKQVYQDVIHHQNTRVQKKFKFSTETVCLEIEGYSTYQDQQMTGVTFVLKDNTNEWKKQTEEQVFKQKMEEKERIDTCYLLEGEDEERKEIAKELYDNIGQLLSTAMFNLRNIGFYSKEGKQSKVKQATQESEKLIQHTLDEVRDLSFSLMPMILTDYGLQNTLKQLQFDFQTKYHIHIDADFYCTQDKYSENIEMLLFRVVQEVLDNVLQHSQAKNVILQLIEHEERLQLLIEDDGVGFAINTLKVTHQLNKLKNRLKLSKGRLEIESSKGRGTCIIAEIPI